MPAVELDSSWRNSARERLGPAPQVGGRALRVAGGSAHRLSGMSPQSMQDTVFAIMAPRCARVRAAPGGGLSTSPDGPLPRERLRAARQIGAVFRLSMRSRPSTAWELPRCSGLSDKPTGWCVTPTGSGRHHAGLHDGAHHQTPRCTSLPSRTPSSSSTRPAGTINQRELGIDTRELHPRCARCCARTRT